MSSAEEPQKQVKTVKKLPTRKPKLASPISASGLPPVDKNIELYFQSSTGKFWYRKKSRDDRFEAYVAERVTPHLIEDGLFPNKTKEDAMSELAAFMQEISTPMKCIDWAGKIAGMPLGLHDYSNGSRILITREDYKIEPVPGDWPLLQGIIGNMFGEEQSMYFYGWLKVALRCFYDNRNRPGQVLVMAGKKGCGKSLLQRIITELFGGQKRDPFLFLTRGTSFNEELFEAVHLCVEDALSNADIRSRRTFGSMLKQIAANRSHFCHPKGRKAFDVEPLWRMTISLNIEAENIQLLPPLDDSLEDKIIMLRAFSHPMPMDTYENDNEALFRETLFAELPAMIYDILNWELPPEIRDPRFGVKAYQHPDILEMLSAIDPEQKLLELIDTHLFDESLEPWFGTIADLEQEIDTKAPSLARKIFTSVSIGGVYFQRLANKFPERFEKARTRLKRGWKIHPPEELIEEAREAKKARQGADA